VVSTTSDQAMPVLLTIDGGVATVTLNRPERRNALSSQLIIMLPDLVSEAARDDGVRVVVVTGADPAFCAGLDLDELGGTGHNLGLPESPKYPWPWDTAGKPVIGAINGPSVTGGLELALHCDIRVASERAVFADTHARVGQVPGAGLTVNLPRLIGQARAREMSFTGNFVSAQTALAWGLVNHVVSHHELLGVADELARTIAANDAEAIPAINRMYDAAESLPHAEALQWEEQAAREWQRTHSDPGVVADRRARVMSRGRQQVGGINRGGSS